MSNLPRRLTPVQQVLHERPYLRWDLVGVAAVLCVLDYHEDSRRVIIDSLARGITLDALCESNWIDPDDLDRVAEASRRWYASRPSFREWLEAEGGIAWEEGRD